MMSKRGETMIDRDDGTTRIFNGWKWVPFEPEEWANNNFSDEETEGDRRYHEMRDEED